MDTSDLPKLTIRNVTVRSVLVPLLRPLVTRIITIDKMATILIDLETEEGITGRSYLFGFSERGNAYLAPLIRDLVMAAKGERIQPNNLYNKGLKQFTLFGHKGLPLIAISGLDMAYWDALSKAENQPLAAFLGGSMNPIPAYNSNGLGLTNNLKALASEAEELVSDGNFEMVKVRLGRETLKQDLEAFRAIRAAVGKDILLPVDFNQGLDIEEALIRGRALDMEDVYWIEEAIVYDNFDGYARLTKELKTPIQIGENFHGPKDFSDAVTAKACVYSMPDLERIGGVTGWLCAAAIAKDANIPMSSHIFPEASAHVMSVTPTAHRLEFTNWANPILTQPLKIENGQAIISDRPGIGLEWDEVAVRMYQVEV